MLVLIWHFICFYFVFILFENRLVTDSPSTREKKCDKYTALCEPIDYSNSPQPRQLRCFFFFCIRICYLFGVFVHFFVFIWRFSFFFSFVLSTFIKQFYLRAWLLFLFFIIFLYLTHWENTWRKLVKQVRDYWILCWNVSMWYDFKWNFRYCIILWICDIGKCETRFITQNVRCLFVLLNEC